MTYDLEDLLWDLPRVLTTQDPRRRRRQEDPTTRLKSQQKAPLPAVNSVPVLAAPPCPAPTPTSPRAANAGNGALRNSNPPPEGQQRTQLPPERGPCTRGTLVEYTRWVYLSNIPACLISRVLETNYWHVCIYEQGPDGREDSR
jgi:hypothetical protein